MDEATEDPGAEAAAAPRAAAADVVGEIEARYFPETTPEGHPAPYLSGAWHHARAAFAELKARLAAL